MSKYWHVLGIGIQINLTYRVNFLARALFGLIQLMVVSFLWWKNNSTKGPDAAVSTYTLAHMIPATCSLLLWTP